jgi:hypothetical protein
MAAKRTSAAIGFSVHTGWAAAVVLQKGAPYLLHREKVQLFDDPYRFAYHAAAQMPWKAKEFIGTAEKKALAGAKAFLKQMQQQFSEHGLKVALSPPKRELPPLEDILQAHPLLHTAEGELYRKAIARAAEALEIPILGPAKGSKPPIDKPGPPWGKDQRDAAALAWAALSIQT